MKSAVCCLLFLISWSHGVEVLQEDIAFPSGITLKPVSEDARFPDIEKTGSRTFKVGLGEVTDARRVSLNIGVGQWRDESEEVFRIHPVFIACLQKVWSQVQNSGKTPLLKEGFLAAGGTSLKDRYRKSGTGATLGFASSEANKDYKFMAKSFLQFCPPLFGPLGRDLGMIIQSDAIFVYMTGTKSPSVQTVTVAGNSQFAGVDINAWVRTQLNEVTDPLSVPVCATSASSLSNGGVHPSSASSNPSDTVGGLDRIVRRSASDPDRQDFLRLIQFSSDNMEFVIPTSDASCPAEGIQGNGPTTRCGPRVMAPRMYVKINILQKMVRTTLSTKLRLEEGYTDENVGTVNALRGEGRQVKIRLVASNTAARLSEVSKMAICAGFDFVKHGGDHLILAVAKQLKVSTKPVAFPTGNLIPVEVPAADWNDLYKLDDGFDSSLYPLFDSQLRPSAELEEGVPASAFKSREEDVRYFRVSPLLVKCFAEVILWENRGRKEGQPKIIVKVVRAFISNMEEASLFNPIDVRLNKHPLGLALHLNYENSPKGYDVWRLAETVATVCPSIVYNQEDKASNGRGSGLGIYTDGVYVDIREKTNVWLECEDCDRLKPPSPMKDLEAKLMTRMMESQANRIIEPNNFDVACTFDHPPRPQDPSYAHVQPEALARVKRSTTGSADCQMSAPMSTFCQISRRERENQVTLIWNIIKMKHLLTDESKVRAALDGCLLSCSKCASGPQWDNKVKHCDNLVHWIPFGFLNDREGVVTNVYPRTDKMARLGACEGSGHCLDHTPIYGLFAPALDSKFRTQPGKANKELVYDPVQNPSPLINLISQLYGLYSRGQVIIFLRSEADIAGMEDIMKTIFVYNRKVESVHFNILDKSAEGTIISSIEGRLDAWRTSVCPRHTRIALTPYSVSLATISESYAHSVGQRIRDEEDMLNNGGLRRHFI